MAISPLPQSQWGVACWVVDFRLKKTLLIINHQHEPQAIHIETDILTQFWKDIPPKSPPQKKGSNLPPFLFGWCLPLNKHKQNELLKSSHNTLRYSNYYSCLIIGKLNSVTPWQNVVLGLSLVDALDTQEVQSDYMAWPILFMEEIRRSRVKVGSLFHYLGLYIPWGCYGFLNHQQ